MKIRPNILLLLILCIYPTISIAADQTIKQISDAINRRYLWTGFYSGINIGLGLGGFSNNTIESSAINNYSAAGDVLVNGYFPSGAIKAVSSILQFGFIGGGQVGYNYQLTSKYLVGLEADLQWTSISGKANYKAFDSSFATNNGNAPHETYYAIGNGNNQNGLNWFSTVRGRLGYSFNRDAIVFATGGIAYANVFNNSNNSLTLSETYMTGGSEAYETFSSRKDSSNMKLGWVTGVGAEWMFAKNFSLKAETLYYDLGKVNFTASPVIGAVDEVNFMGAMPKISVRYDGILAKFGVNYHFNLSK